MSKTYKRGGRESVYARKQIGESTKIDKRKQAATAKRDAKRAWLTST